MTTKSIVTAALPSTLTTAYTNNTTAGAVLKAINLNGIGDPSSFNTTTGSTEYSFFGSSVNPINQSYSGTGYGYGIPYPVQLTDDRVLLLFLPHYQHIGCQSDYMNNNTIHTQIVESIDNKYVNYPIVNITTPTTPFDGTSYSLWSTNMSGGYGQVKFKALALSPTVVVLAYRYPTDNAFRIMRLNISDNAVDQTNIVNLDLTGASYFNTTNSSAFDIAKVPGDTTKVLVGGCGASNYSIQAINVPVSGAMSAASSLFNLGIANNTYGFSFDSIVGTATSNTSVFLAAMSTAATTYSTQLFSYVSTTNVLALVGTAVSVTSGSSGNIYGLNVVNLSNDTTANGGVGQIDSGNTAQFYFNRQTSLTQATTSVSSLPLQHSSARGILESFDWGPSKSVFVGDTGTLVCVNSNGTLTNLLPSTETQDTTRIQSIWIPFNRRPLYNIYDPRTVLSSRVPQFYTRSTNLSTVTASASGGTATLTFATQPAIPFVVGQTIVVSGVTPTAFNGTFVVTGTPTTNTVQYALTGTYGPQTISGNINGSLSTGTALGTTTFKNTYFPWGHNYGNNYAWNEQANCWITAMGGRIYSLDTTGNVLDEVSLYDLLPTGNYYTANIKQLHVTPSGKIIFVTESYNGVYAGYNCNTNWASLSNTLYTYALNPLQNNLPTLLSKSTIATSNSLSGFLTCSLSPILDGSDSAYLLYVQTIATPIVAIAKYDGNNWSSIGSTSVASTTAGAWNVGFRPNYKLIQDSQINGTWRIIGSTGTNTLANSTTFAISTVAYNQGSFGSLSCDKQLSNSTSGYGVTFGVSNNMHIAAGYDNANSFNRIFWNASGQMMTTAINGGYKVYSQTSTALRFNSIAVSRYAAVVASQNTASTQNSPIVSVFDTLTWDVPKYTHIPSLGSGYVTTYPTGKLGVQIYGTNTDKIYTVSGWNDIAKVYITINNGINDFYLTPQLGQNLSTNINSNFRNTDGYLIPPTYSVKLYSNSQNSISSLLTVVEES